MKAHQEKENVTHHSTRNVIPQQRLEGWRSYKSHMLKNIILVRLLPPALQEPLLSNQAAQWESSS